MKKGLVLWGAFILIILVIIGAIVGHNVYKANEEEKSRIERINNFSNSLPSEAREELEQYGLTRYLTTEEIKDLKELYRNGSPDKKYNKEIKYLLNADNNKYSLKELNPDRLSFILNGRLTDVGDDNKSIDDFAYWAVENHNK
ncbi:hypothetical protein HCJ52_13780 [Listeria sp. FSL L7-1485]|uniref:Secreted protein n=1 Tax=Listeria immobilis TaxID=2713502 RepID=A0ABR6T035_9LIST|nr:hypothetical protein [Listeria immobilis]MBC1483969.1 hypothetical protein [Listeria immobilis]MBC1508186.1 hypothetical protein [Listeria immobilis]MBC1511202.1 hypothetical protein [Listeria immobilis]MBC1537187.1 hypothetical protein [Listeria immobilis]MBC6304269.1 hypothetical protein [Listeria immobilis]